MCRGIARRNEGCCARAHGCAGVESAAQGGSRSGVAVVVAGRVAGRLAELGSAVDCACRDRAVGRAGRGRSVWCLDGFETGARVT